MIWLRQCPSRHWYYERTLSVAITRRVRCLRDRGHPGQHHWREGGAFLRWDK